MIIFAKHNNEATYYTPKHTNSYSYLFSSYTQIAAVLAGGLVGSEILNYHEPQVVRIVKQGRRFYIPVVVCMLGTLDIFMV